MSLSHLPFCGLCVCCTEFYRFHSCHTCWFVGSVSDTHNYMGCMDIILVGLSITHNCMGSMHITLVGLWVLCSSHIIVWIPRLSCWVCGFHVSQNVVGSIFWSYNCMGSMLITLAALWVLCHTHNCMGFDAYHACWFVGSVFWSYNFLGSYHFVGSVSFALTILWVLCHCLYFVISDLVRLSGVISHTFACGLAVFSLVSSGMLALLVSHITHMVS